MKLNPKLRKRFLLIHRKAEVIDQLYHLLVFHPDRLGRFKSEKLKTELLDKSEEFFEQLIIIHKVQFL